MSVIDERPLTRAERRKRQTRQKLIHAAWQLFVEVGYREITIKAITELADLGYGTFYLHFEDKDDIIWELIEHEIERTQTEQEKTLAQVPWRQREFIAWVQYFRYLEETQRNYLEMFGEEGSAKLIERYQNRLAEIHYHNMDRGFYSSGLGDDVPLVFLSQFMAGAMLRLSLWWLTAETDYQAEQVAAMLHNTMYRQPVPDEWMQAVHKERE